MNFKQDCQHGTYLLGLFAHCQQWIKLICFSVLLCLAVFICLVVTFSSHAASPKPLKIVTEYIPPYQFYDKDNQLTGLSVEVVQLLLKSVGNPHNPIKIEPWKSAYDLALRQPNVMIFSIARSREREKQFKWVGDILKQHYFFIALKSRSDIQVKNIQDVKRFTIGVADASYDLEVLRRYGFSAKHNLKLSSEQMPLIHQLFDGKVDMLFGFRTTLMGLMDYIDQDVSRVRLIYQIKEPPVNFGIAFSQGTDDDVVQQYRVAYRSLKQRGQVQAIVNKWLKFERAN